MKNVSFYFRLNGFSLDVASCLLTSATFAMTIIGYSLNQVKRECLQKNFLHRLAEGVHVKKDIILDLPSLELLLLAFWTLRQTGHVGIFQRKSLIVLDFFAVFKDESNVDTLAVRHKEYTTSWLDFEEVNGFRLVRYKSLGYVLIPVLGVSKI